MDEAKKKKGGKIFPVYMEAGMGSKDKSQSLVGIWAQKAIPKKKKWIRMEPAWSFRSIREAPILGMQPREFCWDGVPAILKGSAGIFLDSGKRGGKGRERYPLEEPLREQGGDAELWNSPSRNSRQWDETEEGKRGER